MNFQYYVNYIAIVEEGSLTSASNKLGVAQPALSNQIKAMEQVYNTRLFHRGSGSHRLELTETGRILYEKSKIMVEAENSAKNEIANHVNGTRTILKIGVLDSLDSRGLLALITEYSEQYPETEIVLREAQPVTWVFLLRSRPAWENGRITAGRLRIRCPEGLTFSAEEKHVTDPRMARNWQGSLWRVLLRHEPEERFRSEFVFSAISQEA